MSGLKGLLSRISDGASMMSEKLMPEPSMLRGILAPEDVAAARQRGLLSMGAGILNGQGNGLQAIAQGVMGGQQAFDGAIQSQVAQRDYMQAEGDEQMKRQQQQHIMRSRAEIASRFPMPANANESQRAAILQQMMVAYAQAGDTEMAGKIGEVVKSLGRDPNQKTEWVDFGGYKELQSPDGTVIKRVQKTPTPRDPNAPDSAALLRTSRIFNMEDRLSDDFNKDTKAYREIHQTIQNAVGSGPAAMQGDPASQINLLYAFVKAMDPNSAVREGEIGLVNAATPFRARALAMIDKYTTDRSVAVPPEMVQSMVELMQQRAVGIEEYVGERQSYYNSRASRVGIDGTDLFPATRSVARQKPKKTGPFADTSKGHSSAAPGAGRYSSDNPFAK